MMSTSEFIAKAIKVHGIHYDYSQAEYQGSTKPVAVLCKVPNHGVWYPLPCNFLRNHGCPHCAPNHPVSLTAFIERASKIHAEKYDYSQCVYVSVHVPVRIGCPTHGIFLKSPANHYKGQGCPACSTENWRIKTNADERSTFVEKAKKAHAGKGYDFSESVYVNNRQHVRVTCPLHGIWETSPQVLLKGHGCPRCGHADSSSSQRLTKTIFVEMAGSVHGSTYDYSDTIYRKWHDNCEIKCQIHGVFSQSAASHLRGSNCPQCSTETRASLRRLSQHEFLRRALAMHPGIDTSLAVYTGYMSDVVLLCKKHGKFYKSPCNLLRGQGCPKCNYTKSKGESTLADWIRSLGVVIEQRNRRLIKPQELDIIIPERKLAVEYNGVYWHSSPITDRFVAEVRNYHAAKAQRTKAAGYRLLTVWETDWDDRPDVVKHWLLHQLGLSPRLCGARQCSFKPVTSKDAAIFYDRYHLQGACASGRHFGLYNASGLVALMTLSRSASDRKTITSAGTYWLTRFALAGSIPGAATKLFKLAVAEVKASEVVTYSDHTYASGNIYVSLGFEPAAQVKPDYRVYHPFYGIRHKSFWQRKHIPDRVCELGFDTTYDAKTDPRTEFDMEDLLGCRHVWDAGKTRWCWKV